MTSICFCAQFVCNSALRYIRSILHTDLSAFAKSETVDKICFVYLNIWFVSELETLELKVVERTIGSEIENATNQKPKTKTK